MSLYGAHMVRKTYKYKLKPTPEQERVMGLSCVAAVSATALPCKSAKRTGRNAP
jgi:hypothetical protein